MGALFSSLEVTDSSSGKYLGFASALDTLLLYSPELEVESNITKAITNYLLRGRSDKSQMK